MKKDLISIVQEILSDMDSDEVDNIADSEEAEQVARIVASTFDRLVADRVFPEHKELRQIDSLAQSERPNYFILPADIRLLEKFKYKVSGMYLDVYYEDSESFLERIVSRDSTASNVVNVQSVDSPVTLSIYNNKRPQWFTTFNDEYIVCDSFDAAVDTTLQTTNTLAMVSVLPSAFLIEDDFIPDLDAVHFPMFIQECKSMCFALLKGVNQKVEQSSRRSMVKTQNDLNKVKIGKRLVDYGR